MKNQEYQRIENLVNNFRGRRIAIFGDLMLDRYIKGSVRRISPEAPVPVVLVKSESFVCGGASNVAVNLAALSGKPVIISVCGQDEPSEFLEHILKDSGVDTSYLVRDKKYPTIEKIRVLAENQQIVRVDKEAPERMTPSARAKALNALQKAVGDGCETVILSDYGKGLFDYHTIRKAIEIARNAGLPVFVDPKIDHFQHYKGVTCITPNTAEAFGGMRQTRRDDQQSAEKLGKKILSRLGCETLIITQGEHGLTLFNPKNAASPVTHIPTKAREVFDVSGAGDTVIATLAIASAAGAIPEEAAKIANFAAGVVVGKLGTATLTPQELLEHAEFCCRTADI